MRSTALLGDLQRAPNPNLWTNNTTGNKKLCPHHLWRLNRQWEKERAKLLENKAPRLTENEQLSMSAVAVMCQLCRPPLPAALPAPRGPSPELDPDRLVHLEFLLCCYPSWVQRRVSSKPRKQLQEADLLRNSHCLLQLVGCSPG